MGEGFHLRTGHSRFSSLNLPCFGHGFFPVG